MNLDSYKAQLLAQLDVYKAKVNEVKAIAEGQIAEGRVEAQKIRRDVESQIEEARNAIEGLAESGLAIGKDTVEDAKGVAEKLMGEVAAKVDELKNKIGG